MTPSFLSDPSAQVELGSIERRRAMAQALMMQSQQPLQGRQAGSYYVAPSALEGLANVLRAYAGVQGQEKADQATQELVARDSAARQQRMEQYLGMMGQGGTGPQMNPIVRAMALDPNPAVSTMALTHMLKDTDEKFGHTPQIEMGPDGKPHAYAYGDRGSRRDLGPVTPRDKMEVVNLGGTSQTVNPYAVTPGTVMPHTQTPDSVARLAQQQQHWENLSPFQKAELAIQGGNLAVNRGQLANAQTNTFFNTGMGPGGFAPIVPGGTPSFGGAPAVPMPQVTGQTAPQAAIPPAMAPGVVTPKVAAERRAAQPHETQAVQGVMLSLQNAIDSTNAVANSPGLSNITGPVMGRVPNITGQATNAQAHLDTLKAQIGVEVLNAMRAASKTGGAVGQVTEKEWPILQNQLGALQQSQTTGQFKQNLQVVQTTLRRMQDNARIAYEQTYGAVNFAPPQGASNLSPTEQQELQQLRARYGR